jgi:hypothetical protein
MTLLAHAKESTFVWVDRTGPRTCRSDCRLARLSAVTAKQNTHKRRDFCMAPLPGAVVQALAIRCNWWSNLAGVEAESCRQALCDTILPSAQGFVSLRFWSHTSGTYYKVSTFPSQPFFIASSKSAVQSRCLAVAILGHGPTYTSQSSGG